MKLINILCLVISVSLPQIVFSAGKALSCEKPILVGPTDSKPNRKVDLIVVYKSLRRMVLVTDDQVQKQYRVALGLVPVGHKQQQGDWKTPEGLYKIDFKNSRSDFHLSLRISYPDRLDIKEAKKRNIDPGGDIMIHGFPKDPTKYKFAKLAYDMGLDWTVGCIAVTNDEIEEIYSVIDAKTPIEICP